MTITLDEARKWRVDAGAPLDWPNDVPPPPLSRVAFTTLVLNAAVDAGLEMPERDIEVGTERDPRKRGDLTAFQKAVHRYTARQSFNGIPTVRVSIHSGGLIGSGGRRLPWGEYLERLEDDYFEPWREAFRFGAALDARHNVFEVLVHLPDLGPTPPPGWVSSLPQPPPHWQPLPSNAVDDPDAYGRLPVSRVCPLVYALGFVYDVERATGVRIELTVDRTFGLNWWGLLVGLFVIACATPFTLSGVAVTGRISWWWLLTVPLIWVALLAISFALPQQQCWINSKLTVGELADRIVAENRKRWERLQTQYASVPELG